jgi:YD repeat-containing protein
MNSATHPETGETRYGRDDAGNMTSKKVGAGGTAIYAYDFLNRLKTITYPGTQTSQVVNEWSKTNRLRSVSNAVATRTY